MGGSQRSTKSPNNHKLVVSVRNFSCREAFKIRELCWLFQMLEDISGHRDRVLLVVLTIVASDLDVQ